MAAVTARQLARVLEHLMRADEIEWLEAIEDHEVDAALVHFFTLRSARPWRQPHLSHDLRHAGQLLTGPGHARWTALIAVAAISLAAQRGVPPPPPGS